MAAKTLKKPVSLTDNEVQTFLEGEKTNITYKKKKPKVMYSVALVLAFFATENENRQLEDSLPAHFSHISESILLSVRTKSITENFVN